MRRNCSLCELLLSRICFSICVISFLLHWCSVKKSIFLCIHSMNEYKRNENKKKIECNDETWTKYKTSTLFDVSPTLLSNIFIKKKKSFCRFIIFWLLSWPNLTVMARVHCCRMSQTAFETNKVGIMGV